MTDMLISLFQYSLYPIEVIAEPLTLTTSHLYLSLPLLLFCLCLSAQTVLSAPQTVLSYDVALTLTRSRLGDK